MGDHSWYIHECPLFWKINKVAVINRIVSQIIFVISEIKTLHFNKHDQCYEVAVPTKLHIIKISHVTCLTMNQGLKGIRFLETINLCV